MFDRHRFPKNEAGPLASDVRAMSAPWGPLPTAQFAAWTDEARAPPVAQSTAPTAFEAGFADGWAAAETHLADVHAAQHGAQQNLADALSRLNPTVPADVAATLKSALLSLLDTLVGGATVDAELLSARCADLAALASPDQSAALHLHPDDLPLVTGLISPIPTVADPALTRGAVRLVDGAGSITAGPAVMLDRLRAHWDGAPPPC